MPRPERTLNKPVSPLSEYPKCAQNVSEWLSETF